MKSRFAAMRKSSVGSSLKTAKERETRLFTLVKAGDITGLQTSLRKWTQVDLNVYAPRATY